MVNAKTLANALTSRDEVIATNNTENHLILWDLRQHGITGSKMEKILDAIHITTNKNTLVGDSAVTPGGIRLGTPAVTTRGMKEWDME